MSLISSRSAKTIGLILLVCCYACSSEDLPTPESSQAIDSAPSPLVAGFTPEELVRLRSLSMTGHSAAPTVASNPVADATTAQEFGHSLFFDNRLSADRSVSCSHCHRPELDFTDGLERSVGLAETPRNAPTLIGVGHATWLYWDGRRDSLWAQALAPIEASAEHGLTRIEAVRLLHDDPDYRRSYATLFGPMPDFSESAGYPLRASPFGDREARRAWDSLAGSQRVAVNQAFANLGRAIGAYERLFEPAPSRFDRYVERLLDNDEIGARKWLDAEEVEGLRLFIDEARTQCLRCHNGPLFTNQSFHNVGTSRSGQLPDLGRFLGLQALLIDEFNCIGRYSGVAPSDCAELRFLNRAEVDGQAGAFKTPTLRSLARTAPYSHDGRFSTLGEVIAHYRNPPAGGQHELLPLSISDAEARALERFLLTLGEGSSADGRWLRPPEEMSDLGAR